MKTLASLLTLLLVALVPASAQIADTAADTKPLAKGAKAPAGKLIAADGKATTLAELAKTKPVALVFYRGHWCPLCMRHLKQFDPSTAAIKKAGYQLIGVAPDAPKDIARAEAKLGLSFPLYSDPDNTLAQGFGLAFKSRKNTTLPIPAVYAIGADGSILFGHADPNYRKRLAPADLLEGLKK